MIFTALKVQLITVSIRSNRMLKRNVIASKNQNEKYAATEYKSILNEWWIYNKKHNLSIISISKWLFLHYYAEQFWAIFPWNLWKEKIQKKSFETCAHKSKKEILWSLCKQKIQWRSCIFILCYTYLKLALLHHKAALS